MFTENLKIFLQKTRIQTLIVGEKRGGGDNHIYRIKNSVLNKIITKFMLNTCNTIIECL